MDFSLTFTAQQLEQINPFYFTFNQDLQILTYGASLKKLVPNIEPGIALTELCTIVRPHMSASTVDFSKSAGSLFVLKLKHTNLHWKGQIMPLPLQDIFLFLGNPAVTQISQLTGFGLSVNDFAVHDPVIDYLFLLQTASQTLTESAQFSQEIALRAEEERKGLGRFPSESPYPILRFANDGRLLYANESSRPLLELWSCRVNEHLTAHWQEILLQAAQGGPVKDLELACGDLYFSLDVVPIEKTDYLNVYARDITDKKLADALIETARIKAISSAKMAALGEMAGGVAHEVNNPLAIIEGKAKQLKRQISMETLSPDKLEEALDIICLTTERISKIVRGLRSFSRSAEHDPFEQAYLEHVMTDALSLCRERFYHHSIDLIVAPISPQLSLECRVTEISQVLLNFLSNSFDAVAGTSKPWVHLEHEATDELITIIITDSGPGIEKEIQKRMFQPFYTTKEVGKGTGLGLSISKSIIEGHNGSLYYEPDCANTRFVIKLPRRQPAG